MLDVWDELMAMERRVDDLFRAVLGPKARLSFPALPHGVRRPFIPASDVFTRDGDLVIDLELPGIDPAKDVTVAIEGGDLVVRGERRHSEEIKEEDYYRMESSYGSFERRLALPEGATEKDVHAQYRDGILEITLPAGTKRLPKAESKKIPVETGSTAK